MPYKKDNESHWADIIVRFVFLIHNSILGLLVFLSAAVGYQIQLWPKKSMHLHHKNHWSLIYNLNLDMHVFRDVGRRSRQDLVVPRYVFHLLLYITVALKWEKCVLREFSNPLTNCYVWQNANTGISHLPLNAGHMSLIPSSMALAIFDRSTCTFTTTSFKKLSLAWERYSQIWSDMVFYCIYLNFRITLHFTHDIQGFSIAINSLKMFWSAPPSRTR